jgi:hypothetical protein
MEKNGMLTDKSISDYDTTKKAEYYDAEGFNVADEKNKHKLNKPEPVNTVQGNKE